MKRQCSFLEESARLPLPLPTIRASTQYRTNRTRSCLDTLPGARSPELPQGPSDPSTHLRYGTLHLRLLHHFEHQLVDQMSSVHPGVQSVVGVMVEEAFTTPYLMDELLAYSAAHKSTLGGELKPLFEFEATRLQTQALALFNKETAELSMGNCLAMFIFSSLLGQHVLFDVFCNSPDDLTTIVDGLTRCIGLYRGVSAIARSAWPMLNESLQGHFLQSCVQRSADMNNVFRNECESLLARLDASDLSPSSLAIYCEAVEVLHGLFNGQDPLTASRRRDIDSVQEWLVRVSPGFIENLQLRRPEALVILAHFAVIVDQAAQYWYVGSFGKRLIRLIENHLGPFWADWLKWPREMTNC
jgi:hypothetical protein